jgi:hypothetical protein
MKKMNNFGKLKTKILNKLIESYSEQNKKDIKNILKLIKEDKEFKEMYLFYEGIEKLELLNPGYAELYIESIEKILPEKNEQIKETYKKISKLVSDVNVEDNELYESIDILSEKTTLNNIDKKVIAKSKLIEHISKPKAVGLYSNDTVIPNETLLNTVLVNNFNIVYDATLNEEEKETLKNLISMSDDDLDIEIKNIKETILNDVSNLLKESTDKEFNEKLESVKDEVNSMSKSKYNYYRLQQLKNGLN